jgi:hypothetical protein
MMGLLSRGSVQSYFYLFEGLGINSHIGDVGQARLYDKHKKAISNLRSNAGCCLPSLAVAGKNNWLWIFMPSEADRMTCYGTTNLFAG